jgi:Sigma-70, region 4
MSGHPLTTRSSTARACFSTVWGISEPRCGDAVRRTAVRMTRGVAGFRSLWAAGAGALCGMVLLVAADAGRGAILDGVKGALPPVPSLERLPTLPSQPAAPSPGGLPSAPAPRLAPAPAIGGGTPGGSGSPQAAAPRAGSSGPAAAAAPGAPPHAAETAGDHGASGTARSDDGAPRSENGGGAADRRAVARRRATYERRLRRAVAQLRGCFYAIPTGARRVLALRAGLAGGPPRSRAYVADRLDVSGTRVARIERRALRRLRSADRADGCSVRGSAVALVTSGSGLRSLLPAVVLGRQPALVDTDSLDGRGGVLGARASSGGDGGPDADGTGPRSLGLAGDLDSGAGPDHGLILILLLISAGLLAAILSLQRGRTGGAPSAPGERSIGVQRPPTSKTPPPWGLPSPPSVRGERAPDRAPAARRAAALAVAVSALASLIVSRALRGRSAGRWPPWRR